MIELKRYKRRKQKKVAAVQVTAENASEIAELVGGRWVRKHPNPRSNFEDWSEGIYASYDSSKPVAGVGSWFVYQGTNYAFLTDKEFNEIYEAVK